MVSSRSYLATVFLLMCGFAALVHGQVCLDLPSVANGMLGYSMNGTVGTRSEGTVASYSCDNGYYFVFYSGSSERTCQSNGEWSGVPGLSCGVPCPLSTSVVSNRPATIYFLAGAGDPPGFPPGTKATGVQIRIECESGFVLIGSDSLRTCQSDGTWSGSTPTCHPITCADLTPPANGAVEHSDPTLPRDEGSTATYSCDTGYVVTGDSVRMCTSSGWSGSDPVCTAMTEPPPFQVTTTDTPVTLCSDLTPPTNGMTTYNGGSTSNRPVGTVATYSCDTGYTLNGGSTRTCQSDESWSGSAPSCQVSNAQGFCGSPPSITNGSPGTPTSTLVGGTVMYNCDPGYVMSESQVVTCLSTGDWSSLPSCQVAPPVYLSLSSTNYLSGLSEIPLSSVGEGHGNSLVCHTDLAACCRQLDSGVEGGLGTWHYPDGSTVSADSAEDGLYVTREQMNVSLNYRREAAAVTTGLYCCVLPTVQGYLSTCIVLKSQQGVLFSTTISEQDDSQSADFITAIVGSVVAMVIVTILSVCLTITTYLILRYKKGVHVVPNSNDVPLSDHDQDQSAVPTYETVMITGTYEDVIASTSTEVKGDFKGTQNPAYVNTAVSKSGSGTIID